MTATHTSQILPSVGFCLRGKWTDFLRSATLWISSAVLLIGNANAQPVANDGHIGKEFIGAFRQAHDQRDIDAMSRLVCWDRVTPEFKAFMLRSLRESFEQQITGLRLTTEHPRTRVDRFKRNEVTFAFNLPVVVELIAENPPASKNSSAETYYPLALKNGRYCIAQMAPVDGVEQKASSRTNPLPQVSLPSTSGTQQTVIPAKTVLTISLTQDLGLKTVETGGHFSATVAEPVLVNGITVIPVGAPVSGVADKKGNYSPGVKLTAVIVNGTSHKIVTTYLSFNPSVVFPAGSNMKFELVFPAKAGN